VVLRNPAAGAEDEDELEHALAAIEADEVRVSAGPGDLERLAREAGTAGDVAEVVVAGGDGSLNEVVNGLAPEFRPRVALLPLGTGNDLARALGIADGVGSAVSAILAGGERRIDVVRVDHAGGSRHFVNASAGGFSTEVDRQLSTAGKTAFGRFAYYVSAGRALADLVSHRLTVRVDDGPATTVAAYNFVVSNGPTIAGGLRVAPGAHLDDGRVELLVVPAVPLLRCAALLARILAAEHVGGPDAIVRRGRRIELDSDPPLEFNVDGELVGRTPATFHTLPRALRVAVAPS